MNTLKDAHTCSHCQDIKLDGTGTELPGRGLLLRQLFRFDYIDVRAFATVCLLFRWCLRLAIRDRLDLKPTHKVSFSVNTDSEDIAHLYVRWEDESGQALATGDVDNDTPLYVFSNKGMSCLLTFFKLS